jgi:TP901 family phage tail tape measure protein
MASLGDLFVSIKGDTKEFDKSIDTTKKKTDSYAKDVEKFGKTMNKYATLPILAVGAGLVKLTTSLGKNADKLLDLEQITGLSTNTLQEFQNVATVAGVSFEGLTGVIQKFSSRLPTIESGTSETAVAFNKLGVALKDSNGEIRSSEDLFPELITALQDIENVTDRNATAQQVFGRSLGDLAPVLGLTAEATKEARDQAYELGLVWERDSIEQANEFRIQTEQLTKQFKQQGVELGSSLIPIFQEALPAISNLISKVADGVEFFSNLSGENKKLIFQIAGVVAAIGPATTAVTALGTALKVLAAPKGGIGLAIAGLALLVTYLNQLKGKRLVALEKQMGDLADNTDLTADKAQDLLQAYDLGFGGVSTRVKKLSQDFKLSQGEVATLILRTGEYAESEKVLLQQIAQQYERQQEFFRQQQENKDEEREKNIEIVETEIELQENKLEVIKGLTQEERELKERERLDTVIAEKELEELRDQARVDRTEKQRVAAEEEKAIQKEKQDAVIASIGLITGAINSLYDIELNNIESTKNSKLAALDQQELGEEQYAAEVKKIEDQAALDSWEVQKQLYESNKVTASLEAGINTALGVTSALGSAPPPFNIALAAITAAAGAIQIANIQSQPAPPRPQLATGAIIPGSQRGVDVTVAEGGNDELILGGGQQGEAILQRFADTVVNFNSLVSVSDPQQLRNFAQTINPYIEEVQESRL